MPRPGVGVTRGARPVARRWRRVQRPAMRRHQISSILPRPKNSAFNGFRKCPAPPPPSRGAPARDGPVLVPVLRARCSCSRRAARGPGAARRLARAVRVALARAAARVDGRHGADGGGGEACEEQRARAAQHRRVRWRLQALGEQQHRQHSGPVTARKKGKPQSLVCARYVLALKDWVCTPAPRMSCIKLGVACRLVCYRSLANRRRAAWLAPLWRTDNTSGQQSPVVSVQRDRACDNGRDQARLFHNRTATPRGSAPTEWRRKCGSRFPAPFWYLSSPTLNNASRR